MNDQDLVGQYEAMSSHKLPAWSGPMIGIFGGSESGSRSATPMPLSKAFVIRSMVTSCLKADLRNRTKLM